MPSPTIAVLPLAQNARTRSSLPSGSTLAMASSVPTSRCITAAVRASSPVSMTVLTPIACRRSMACLLVGLTTSAQATISSALPSRATISGVLPSSARRFVSVSNASTATPVSRNRRSLPATQTAPSTMPLTPRPATVAKSSTDCASTPILVA